MSLLYQAPRCLTGSLQTFSEYSLLYKDGQLARIETNEAKSATSGELLEYETLALRLCPPVVEVCNISDPDRTLLTIASANRPGTLVEVVQGLTELGLDVHRARISSDGGWFVDVFEITEGDSGKVRDPHKLSHIQQMLDVHSYDDTYVVNADETNDYNRVETTVFELAGHDKAGLLAEVTDLLCANDCNVRSAAVWTHEGRVAFVLSVTERGRPVSERKLDAFHGRLMGIMDAEGEGIVRMRTARGEVHHDRRLHQLMLLEASKEWSRTVMGGSPPSSKAEEVRADRRSSSDSYVRVATSPTDSVSSLHEGLSDAVAHEFRSPKHSTPVVKISKCSDRKYWLVNIECKDRNKLLFDTVCTLADLDYDVFHATIDSVDGKAIQEYYIKSRLGSAEWDEARASKLRGMLEASIQRRFPKGLKVHIRSVEKNGCLTELAQRLRTANLSITRAKVKPYSKMTCGQTLYLMSADGSAPDLALVEEACRTIGGKLVESCTSEHCHHTLTNGLHRFSFSFLDRQWRSTWGGSAGSPGSSVTSS